MHRDKSEDDMGRNLFFILIAVIGLDAAVSCEILDNDPDKHAGEKDTSIVGLEEVAEILSLIS